LGSEVSRSGFGHALVLDHTVIQLHNERVGHLASAGAQPYRTITDEFLLAVDGLRPLDHGTIVRRPVEPDLAVGAVRRPLFFPKLVDEPRAGMALKTHQLLHFRALIVVDELSGFKQGEKPRYR